MNAPMGFCSAAAPSNGGGDGVAAGGLPGGLLGDGFPVVTGGFGGGVWVSTGGDGGAAVEPGGGGAGFSEVA